MTEAAVAFGGNLGRPDAAFRTALERMAETAGVEIRCVSRLWRSAPWGDPDQGAFLNAVARLDTALPPREMLALLQALERAAGRVRGRRWGPRTLDLDLLFHGHHVTDEPGLSLPHGRIAERSFVLAPLGEVAPEWRHPVTGRTAGELLEELESRGRATPCHPLRDLRLGETRGAGRASVDA